MVKAIWNGEVIAESDKCEKVENNFYFPFESVKKELLQDSATTSHCGWKGHCNYYSIAAGGKINVDAAWTYRDPLPAAKNITNYVAFWKGVQIA